ncbi:hypothetical protein [Wenjunlia tyrosinilytica]|jgi:hypothetical protein|uniref:Uncharacterized protein n=1 Tax=Wenjunlia tyrosinilytica TaxID=1544741 RepID=A0A917ZWD0_9ACTN|nr:hypothetical protein [Wenjunlia tyrosinilytica]GGO97564.1 hypothetical protein GCM10012280_59660 [Wenjunlia tyrosinilytica]
MAIRKSTMQEQVGQAIAEIAPGDRPIVTLHSITGPSPWLMNGLGVIGQLFVKYYFITVTEQAVVFHKASRVSNRPKELLFAIPRTQAQTLISDIKRNTLWSSFRFHIPGEEKPTRINIARYWRAEMDQLVEALTGARAA